MPWYAKPAWGYEINPMTAEAQANIAMMNGFMNDRGYTLYAQAAVIGNSFAESGLNPWRWESNTVNYDNGYGLFQYTKARAYIEGCRDVEGYAPNLATDRVTLGAMPHDGWAQLLVFDENLLDKWDSGCWVNDPDWNARPDLLLYSQAIRETYGSGTGASSTISLAQFRNMSGQGYETDISSATFAFLACFEKPGTPDTLSARVANAKRVYPYLSGDTPPDPPTPHPVTRKGMPLWMYLKRYPF